MCRETDNTREGGRRRSATNIYPPPNSPPCCALCLGIPVGNACALRALLRVSALVHSKVRTRTRRGSLPRGDRTLAGFLHYTRETPYENAEHVAKLKEMHTLANKERKGSLAREIERIIAGDLEVDVPILQEQVETIGELRHADGRRHRRDRLHHQVPDLFEKFITEIVVPLGGEVMFAVKNAGGLAGGHAGGGGRHDASRHRESVTRYAHV